MLYQQNNKHYKLNGFKTIYVLFKKIRILLIFLGGINLGVSQYSKNTLGYNIGTGICYVNYKSDKSYAYLPRFGFVTTFLYERLLGDIISIKAGIGIEQKGFSFISSRPYFIEGSSKPIPSLMSFKYGLSYCNIPVSLQWYLTKPLKLYLHVGFYTGISFLTSVKYTLYGDVYDKNVLDFNFYTNQSEIKRFDYGFLCGTGLSIPFQHIYQFSIECRYNRGLVNNVANNNYLIVNGGGIRNNSINFLFGFSKRLGMRHNKERTYYY